MGVLIKEKEIMERIIEYKKRRNLDYEDFDFKKSLIENEIDVKYDQ
jgi:hypothetical protein